MPQTRRRIAQYRVGRIERGRLLTAAASHVRMLLRGRAVEGLFQRDVIEPRAACLGEDRKMIGHVPECVQAMVQGARIFRGYTLQTPFARWLPLSYGRGASPYMK